MDELKKTKRAAADVREVLKFLRRAPVAKHGGVDRWSAKVAGLEAELKKLNVRIRALSK